jgi:hypothetical protein
LFTKIEIYARERTRREKTRRGGQRRMGEATPNDSLTVREGPEKTSRRKGSKGSQLIQQKKDFLK